VSSSQNVADYFGSSSHHLSPVRGGGEDEAVLLATKQLMVQRWSILWRSIVASALDATLFPYCRYIKLLDFRDLRYLLEDDQFRGKVMKFVLSCIYSMLPATMGPPSTRWIYSMLQKCAKHSKALYAKLRQASWCLPGLTGAGNMV
jgi:hypothetical protein